MAEERRYYGVEAVDPNGGVHTATFDNSIVANLWLDLMTEVGMVCEAVTVDSDGVHEGVMV